MEERSLEGMKVDGLDYISIECHVQKILTVKSLV